jgi:GTPase SAR1 family protein
MACCGGPSGDPETRAKSKSIDDQIKSDRKEDIRKVKLLLLGTGDSGKSTFLKQMKIINSTGFSRSEVERYRRILRDNTLRSIQVLIEQAQRKEYKIPKKNSESIQAIIDATELEADLVPHIQKMWKLSAIEKTWAERNTFQIHGSADYYIKNAPRFVNESFEPTNEDILRARMRTSGIIETKFELEGMEFTIVDVGGQRTERRKWLHCFDNVTAVIYLAALDEYDMKLEEDQNTNRMTESLKLFAEVTSSQWFKQTGVILFLNKDDLFRDKLPKSPLSKLFSEYLGGDDYESALKFIESKYKEAFGSADVLYTWVTCAIDTQNVERVFFSIRDTVFRRSLQSFM